MVEHCLAFKGPAPPQHHKTKRIACRPLSNCSLKTRVPRTPKETLGASWGWRPAPGPSGAWMGSSLQGTWAVQGRRQRGVRRQPARLCGVSYLEICCMKNLERQPTERSIGRPLNGLKRSTALTGEPLRKTTLIYEGSLPHQAGKVPV